MYVYHAVREDMLSEKIVPMRDLCKTSEELYKGKMSKFPNQYKRENQKVGVLNCEKRDVIFMTPIPPNILEEELKRRVGISFEGTSFYKIDLNKLDRKKMCIYLNFDPDDESEFFPVNDKTLKEFDKYMSYTQEAKEYWENIMLNSTRLRSLLFAGTYLFLHEGEIDISDCEIVTIEKAQPV